MDVRWSKVIRCLLGVYLLSVFIGLTIVWQISGSKNSVLDLLLKGPIAADNEELLSYIRDKILEAPTGKSYHFSRDISTAPFATSEWFYKNKLDLIFSKKRGGFFVEAGALDGETMSVTLPLEALKDWTGLLVEPDPQSYRQLRRKNRQSWSANVCLSVNPFPSMETFVTLTTDDAVTSSRNHFRIKALGVMTRINEHTREISDETEVFYRAQCVPLESLLLAMGVRRVDLLVLDLEGAEMEVLSHLDFEMFDIQVLCIEWVGRKETLEAKMSKFGYVEIANRFVDFIFAKNGSVYASFKEPERSSEK